MDYHQIALLLIEQIKAEYADDIAAVAVYEDAASGQPQGVYLITKTERGRALSRAFLIEEHGVEIECYSYTELAQLGIGDRKNVHRLLDGQLLYVSSEEDAAILDAIRQKVENCGNIDAFLSDLLYACKELYFTFYEKQADAAAIAIKIVQKISCALLMYHNAYPKCGWAQIKEEVLALDRLPECYLQVTEQLCKTADPAVLKNLCRKLIMQTDELLLPKEQVMCDRKPAAEIYQGVYEKAKIYYEKIVAACLEKKANVALFYTADLQQLMDELAAQADQAPQLKNLLDLYYSKDLTSFAVSLYSHEASLIGFLLGLGIAFEQYPSMEQLKQQLLQETQTKAEATPDED